MYYNSSASETAQVPAPDSSSQYIYGDLTLRGVEVTDSVCALGDMCQQDETGVETITFLAITGISKLDCMFDGLFGLAPHEDG